MAGERKLPAVGKVISGTHGYFWWNNSICYEITSFEAKIKTNRETIRRFIQEAKRMRRNSRRVLMSDCRLYQNWRTPITAVQKEYSLCHAGLMNLHFRHLRTEKLPKMNFRADLSDLSILIQSLTRVYKNNDGDTKK